MITRSKLVELLPIGLAKRNINEALPPLSLDAKLIFGIYDVIVAKHPEFEKWYPSANAFYFELTDNLNP